MRNFAVAFILFTLLFGVPSPAQQRRVIVVSIDGLDHRWLRDADQLGLKIPTLRRLMSEGSRADGVVGIVPTVTWPSHTTMVTGLPAWEHGIVSNNQPGKPGQRWWYVEFLKSRTLWQAARDKGLRTAAIWWPVTTGADIDFNLPEFWDDPDLKPHAFAPVARHTTPGLVEQIRQLHPSFGDRHFTDQRKILAARAILKIGQPELMLLHLGELDTKQHGTGAFSDSSKATLEHQDSLLAALIEDLPAGSYVAIVSDHGFETQKRVLRPEVLLREVGIEGEIQVAEGLFGVTSAKAARYFRSLAGQHDSSVAREVPGEELRRMAPALKHWDAAFETVFEIMPVKGTEGPALTDGNQRGYHGLWPTRRGYRAVFLLWGPGIEPRVLPEISMLDIAPTLAELLGVQLPKTEGESLWEQLR